MIRPALPTRKPVPRLVEPADDPAIQAELDAEFLGKFPTNKPATITGLNDGFRPKWNELAAKRLLARGLILIHGVDSLGEPRYAITDAGRAELARLQKGGQRR